MRHLRIIGDEGRVTEDEVAIALVAAQRFRTKTSGTFVMDGPTGARAFFDARRNTVITTPSPYDFRIIALPNPVPHRGVFPSIGDDGFGREAHVVTSDGMTLAREAQTTGEIVPGPGDGVADTPILSQAVWSGGNYIDIFKRNPSNGSCIWDHKLSFEIPEDCIAPAPSDCPYKPVWVLSGGTWVGGITSFAKINTDVFVQEPDGKQSLFASNVTVSWASSAFPMDSLYVRLFIDGSDVGFPPQLPDSSSITTDWAAGQAAFRLRRKNWLKKNSDSVLASLAAGTFSLPRHWDSAIKGLAPVSDHTFRSTLMEATFEDIVKIDTPESVVPVQVGEKLTERTVTFRYIVEAKQPDGSMRIEERKEGITGTLRRTITPHLKDGFPVRWTHRHEYANWYVGESEEDLRRTLRHQLALDKHLLDHDLPNAGMGLAWSGIVDGYMPNTFREMWVADSAYFADAGVNFPNYLPWYAGYEPPMVPFANTLSGSAPQFVLDYRKAAPIQYNADAPGNTEWNDSALQDGQIIKLILFGPAGKGIFGEWDDGTVAGIPADTAIDVFGTASFTYKEGIFTFKSWKPCKDADGADLPLKDGVPTPKTIELGGLTVPQTTGYGGLAQPTMNCIVRYEGLAWPDVKDGAKAHVKAIREGDVEAEENALLFKAVLDALA